MRQEFKTSIPFRKRTEVEPGEIIKIRDGSGRVVEVWECIGSGIGWAEFAAHDYRHTATL